MIVVSDTSLLRYLALIGGTNLLQRLYGRIHYPATVRRQADHPQAPALLRGLTALQSVMPQA
jgi:predicted nucleic acid-binding protein